MKKYILLPLVLISFLVFFLQIPLVLNQQTFADNPNLGPGGNANGGPQSVTVNCTCDNPNQMNIEDKGGHVTTVKNTYKCTDSRYGTAGHCGHSEQVCITLGNGQQIPNNAEGIQQQIVGSTIVHYTGIACQTTVTCECNNKNQVTCLNPVLQQAGAKNSTQVIANCDTNSGLNKNKCEQSTDFNNTNLKTVAWNQPAPGAECQVNCPCDKPDTTGNGNNGWGHTKNSQCNAPGYCNNQEDYCKNDNTAAGGHVCVNSAKCTCSSDKTKINCVSQGPKDAKPIGSQSFDCGGPTCVTGGNVDDPGFKYKNQHITGIECNNPKGPTPIPPPPSPPCLHWDGQGVCQTFGSTFGPFYTNPDGFIQKVFAILLSVSGGIALLLIMKAGYQMMTAQGNPEKLNNAREQLVAAIVGLIFLIFSFVFLQLIGFDILKIPGFQAGQSTANNTAVCAPNSCIPMSICSVKNPGRCNSNGCPSGSACVQ